MLPSIQPSPFNDLPTIPLSNASRHQFSHFSGLSFISEEKLRLAATRTRPYMRHQRPRNVTVEKGTTNPFASGPPFGNSSRHTCRAVPKDSGNRNSDFFSMLQKRFAASDRSSIRCIMIIRLYFLLLALPSHLCSWTQTRPLESSSRGRGCSLPAHSVLQSSRQGWMYR
ncbi:hypothetical protein EXIGLDRAFT_206913 [Exidia glandulosa HHB12029]|uniref:Uncharacterized protein n=1 Tax=Exidia glandulosa HHB12029 TaxID=1314781 RepID=A0A165ELY6_EXIGL|nr:hypothetical protein EXIGLDRAFT_206913 [Exidia glandulosa HHB12029]